MSSTNYVELAIHYGRSIFSSVVTGRKNYVGGKIEYISVDRDRFAILDVLDEVESICKVQQDKLVINYRYPGKTLDDGIGTLLTDEELMAMFDLAISESGRNATIDLYVTCEEGIEVEEGEDDGTNLAHEEDRNATEGDDEREGNDDEIGGGRDSEEDMRHDVFRNIENELSDYDDDPSYFPSLEVSEDENYGRTGRSALRKDYDADTNEIQLHVGLEFTDMCQCRKVVDGVSMHLATKLTLDLLSVHEHTCSQADGRGNKSATQHWVAEQIESRLRADPKLIVIFLKNDLRRLYGINLGYHKVWRARELAMDRIRGSYEDSFARVPSLCKTILKTNPGSSAWYRIADDHSFQRLFICLAACKEGFLHGCRPYIGLDGCFLKGKYKGVLLGAIALDAKNGIVPIAFAVVENDSTETWNHFLGCLREAIGLNKFTFMSDRQKGLVEAVTLVHNYVVQDPNVQLISFIFALCISECIPVHSRIDSKDFQENQP